MSDENAREVLRYFHDRQDQLLGSLQEFVVQETPSTDKAALDRFAGWLRDRLIARGADASIVANPRGGDHVVATFNPASARPTERPALILGHFDTVWPAGTIASRPMRVEGGKFYGPGAFDMKAGLVLAESVLEGISRERWNVPRPIVLVFTSDEEIGSPTTRTLIEEKAREAAYVLVLEPPLPGGALKTARKGVGRFVLEITGRAAHAGIEPEKGRSAVEELAHQIIRLHQLNDRERGTTVNVGVVSGGTRANVVADRATAEVDVRVWSTSEAERVESALRDPRARVPDVVVATSGGFHRPPMEPSPATLALIQQAGTVASGLGFELKTGSVGGASDGNFTAALGIPTLDGLGVNGGGAHAENEHVEIDALPVRAAFIAGLLERLTI